MQRRAFLGTGLAGVAALVTRGSRSAAAPTAVEAPAPPAVKPPRLRAGDVVGLSNPSCSAAQPGDLEGIAFAARKPACPRRDDHVKPLGIPAWRGAQFGHVERQLTLPLGLRVEVDADQGTIRMRERAVA